MNYSLKQIFTEFQQKSLDILFQEQDKFDLSSVTQKLADLSNETARALVATKLETLDDALLDSKQIKAKYKVEHKKRTRTIQSRIGDIKYKRTYFKHKITGKYTYLVDNYARIDKNQRLTNDLVTYFAKAALDLPYRKAATLIQGNEVSTQTVMNAIRRTEPVPIEIKEKKSIDCIHLDVDEDHIAFVEDKKTRSEIVRLAVSYEGIENGRCINPIAIGRYEKDSEEFWETVVDELYDRYDLHNTTVYIHADGASWIAKAKDYFPNTKFVLDKFHKNKYITQIFSCVKDTLDKDLEGYFRTALNTKNIEVVKGIYNYVKNKYSDTITLTAGDAIKYLIKNINGIAICKEDDEANNGGCSEQHVSNYLSNRLSSRPRVWSEKTLSTLVPMLTARREIQIKPMPNKVSKAVKNVASKQSERMLYSYNPDFIGNVPGLSCGKLNWLYNSIRQINC